MTLQEATSHLLRRLSGDDAEALDVLLKTIVDQRRLQALGGPPPPFNDQAWKNQQLPGGPDPEYRGI